MDHLKLQDYPLGLNRPELIKTLTGKNISEITLDALIDGNIEEKDIRISPHTLLLQAQVADLVGRRTLAANFRRAAELCQVPDERVLEIYNSLRPFRCTKEELEQIAQELEQKYHAMLNAKLIREAADAYEARGFLKKQG